MLPFYGAFLNAFADTTALIPRWVGTCFESQTIDGEDVGLFSFPIIVYNQAVLFLPLCSRVSFARYSGYIAYCHNPLALFLQANRSIGRSGRPERILWSGVIIAQYMLPLF